MQNIQPDKSADSTALLKPITADGLKVFERQLTSMSFFRPALLLLVSGTALFSGHFSWVYVLLFGFGLLLAGNAIRWKSKVVQVVNEQRPAKMTVYFSNTKLFSPFLDLKATLFDARSFDPLGQAFKPKWRLLGANFDAKALVGGPQECLVYADRDSGKLYAIVTSLGPVFPRPYLSPWIKIDMPSISTSGDGTERRF